MSEKMKPIIILPPETMSPEDIKSLQENHFCVVVASDPSKVKFLDPIPAISSRTAIENSAIQLSRSILRGDIYRDQRHHFAQMFMDILVKGTPLDPQPQKEEVERNIFDNAKADEIRRLAREEAKAERAAQKAKIK